MLLLLFSSLNIARCKINIFYLLFIFDLAANEFSMNEFPEKMRNLKLIITNFSCFFLNLKSQFKNVKAVSIFIIERKINCIPWNELTQYPYIYRIKKVYNFYMQIKCEKVGTIYIYIIFFSSRNLAIIYSITNVFHLDWQFHIYLYLRVYYAYGIYTLKKTVDPDYKLFLLTLIYICTITWGIYIYAFSLHIHINM